MLSRLAGARTRASFVAVVAAALCCVVGASDALAAKGGKSGSGTGSTGAGMSLGYDYWWLNPNPGAPTWCNNEDDIHERRWTGTLDGTFTTTERLCDPSVDYSGGQYWDAGGEGLQADLWVTGTVNDLAITSPQGDSHHGVLMGSSTTKGVTTDHYSVCYVPTYERTHDTSGVALAGGTWSLSVSGSVKNVTLKLRSDMTDVNYQLTYCPQSEQNLVG
jgi:hypothetical protein